MLIVTFDDEAVMVSSMLTTYADAIATSFCFSKCHVAPLGLDTAVTTVGAFSILFNTTGYVILAPLQPRT